MDARDRHETPDRPPRILFMSSYVPRECGIATYCDDVITAVSGHGASCQVLAMERPGEPYRYDNRVIGTVQDNDPAGYLRAAEMINHGWFDVLSVQHEFGIFGGDEADYLVRLLDAVKIPTVVTFHTLVRNPHPSAQRIQRLIARRADAIVVMNGLAPEILEFGYDIPQGKVAVINHGAPVPHCARHACRRADLVHPDHEVISSFGLLNRTKGLEYMVRAMPTIARARPRAVYYILGRTHPDVVRAEGETYRGELEDLARALGIGDRVRFVDRYLLKRELVEYLLVSDLYVTPYVNLEQITSGTLAYALGSGCPVVSTPYLHAQYLVTEEHGLLASVRDPDGLADAVIALLSDPERKAAIEAQNWAFGQTLYWPRIGADYLRVFNSVRR